MESQNGTKTGRTKTHLTGLKKNVNQQQPKLRLVSIDQSWLPYIIASVILSLGAAVALNQITNLPHSSAPSRRKPHE